MAGQATDANAETAKTKQAPERIKQQVSDISERMRACDSSSALDRLSQKRELAYEMFSGAKSAALMAGTDSCPGTNIPAGAGLFTDTGNTSAATNTVGTVNTSCIVGQSGFYTGTSGNDQIYRFVLPAVGARQATCTIGVTTTGTYDSSIYYLSVGGGGCPNGTGNTVSNCVRGQDQVFGIGTETITDAQMDSTPAGTYFLFIDSFYTAGTGSGAYTLNFNCTRLAPTAAIVGVGGRVTTSDGRGLGNTRVSIMLPSGESKFAVTNQFGYYNFEELEVGQAYVVQVSSKTHQFANGSQLVTVNDTIDNLDFVADGPASK